MANKKSYKKIVNHKGGLKMKILLKLQQDDVIVTKVSQLFPFFINTKLGKKLVTEKMIRYAFNKLREYKFIIKNIDSKRHIYIIII